MLIAPKPWATAPSRHDVQVQADAAVLVRGVKGPGRRHDAEFLDELARQRILRRFARFQMSAGYIPTFSVGFMGCTQSQQYASIAHDQGSNAFPRLVLTT